MMIGHQDRRRSRGRPARAVVGEHSGRRGRRGASRAGASGKENVGMSNDKGMCERPPPKTQGFRGHAKRPRVSRELRVSRKAIRMPMRSTFRSRRARRRRDRGVTLPRGDGIPVEGRRETESRQYGEPSGEPTEQVTILARKACSAPRVGRPYRKPTQVGGERILRRSSESRPRN